MQKAISADDLIQQYAGGRLDFEPGTDWSYSNTGFVILGRIVEKLSGRSFAEFLESRILKTVDRTPFAEEFNLYLSNERLSGAAQRLKLLGPPTKVEVLRIRERGGMEVTTTSL